MRSGLQQAAPTADQLNAVFGDVRESLPQTLANLAIVIDMLKRYHKGLEQALVMLPQGATVAQAGTDLRGRRRLLHFGLAINQPPPCLTGFLPASEWRSPADTSTEPLPAGLYCKIPKDSRATSFAARATTRARTCRASGRRRRRSAAATSRTCRWAPTRGTATRTRS